MLTCFLSCFKMNKYFKTHNIISKSKTINKYNFIKNYLSSSIIFKIINCF